MRKTKRSLLIFISMILISMMMVGCSSKPKVTADETAKIMYNFYFKGDKEGLAKVKLEATEAEEISKLQKETAIITMRNNFKVAGMAVNDQQIEEVYNARMEGFKKLTVNAEVVSQDDENAEVKVKSTYFNEIEINKKASDSAIEEVKKLNLTNEKEALDKYANIYLKNIVEAYKTVEPSQDTKEATFKFVNKEKTWVPEDSVRFGSGLANLILGLQ